MNVANGAAPATTLEFKLVIVGRDTYVPAHLYAAWRPLHESDRIDGTRVANSNGGKSKWRATSVNSEEKRVNGMNKLQGGLVTVPLIMA